MNSDITILTSLSLYTAPGGPPLNILLTPRSPYSITITWLPPAQPNGYITQYTIYINYMNTTVSSVNVPRPSTQYTVTGLSPYQSIMVQVSAWTAVGEGPISESVSDRTEQASKILILMCCAMKFKFHTKVEFTV